MWRETERKGSSRLGLLRYHSTSSGADDQDERKDGSSFLEVGRGERRSEGLGYEARSFGNLQLGGADLKSRAPNRFVPRKLGFDRKQRGEEA